MKQVSKQTGAFTQVERRVRQIMALGRDIAILAGKPYVWRKDDKGRLYTVPYEVAYPDSK